MYTILLAALEPLVDYVVKQKEEDAAVRPVWNLYTHLIHLSIYRSVTIIIYGISVLIHICLFIDETRLVCIV